MEPLITERRRLSSPAITPQALAWHDDVLWMGSRDLHRVYAIDVKTWTVSEETEAPGIPWAAVSTGENIRFTIGEGSEDDRYLRRFVPGTGFSDTDRIACPDFTGSYLSYDGNHLYLSQWYKHRILKLDASGKILRVIDVGAEICGHVFVDGLIYVLRGRKRLTKIGASRVSIRDKNRRRSKTSRRFRFSVARSPSMARTFGRTIASLTRLYRFPCRTYRRIVNCDFCRSRIRKL